MMKKWLAIGGLILVTVIWGGGFVASDMALGSMKPFQIMMVRFLLASVLMGMISMGQHKKEGKLEKRAGAIKELHFLQDLHFRLSVCNIQHLPKMHSLQH